MDFVFVHVRECDLLLFVIVVVFHFIATAAAPQCQIFMHILLPCC